MDTQMHHLEESMYIHFNKKFILIAANKINDQ